MTVKGSCCQCTCLFKQSTLIRHIAITNCPFRFAFSHLPTCRCWHFCDMSTETTLYEICVQVFLRYSNSSKTSQSVSLIYAWLSGIGISGKNMLKTSCKRKRKKSDSVLWQKPLHPQKCQKGKMTTQTTPQNISITQRLRTDLGRSVWVTTATQVSLLLWPKLPTFWWRHDHGKQSASAHDHWCDVSCDILYYIKHRRRSLQAISILANTTVQF